MSAGFVESQVSNYMQNAYDEYVRMMSSLDSYQDDGIEKLCNNWQSNKGKEKITELVTDLNKMIDVINSNLQKLFEAINKMADIIARDSGGISYQKVTFKPIEDHFSSQNAKNDEEAGNVAQWDLTKTNEGVNAIKEYLRVIGQDSMRKISDLLDAVAENIYYSEAGHEISGSVKILASKITELSYKISKGLDGWEEEYLSDASAHKVNVSELSDKSPIDLDLDF